MIGATLAVLLRPPNQAPTIGQVSVSSDFAEIGTPLLFTGQATDPDGDVLTYHWTFGDNSTGTGSTRLHSYALPGSYVASLSVTDGRRGEATDDRKMLFIQARLKPTDLAAPTFPSFVECPLGCTLGPASAILAANQTTVVAGTPVRFTGNASWAFTWAWNNASNPAEGGAAVVVSAGENATLATAFTYAWGDGTPSTVGNSTTVGVTTHTFAAPGNYFVRLSVTIPAIAGTLTAAAGYTVRVSAAAPVMVTRHPGAVTVVTFGEPDSLDPAVDAENSGGEILQNVYETLVWYQSNTENVTALIPRLAESVPTRGNGGVSPDGKNYTFTIRPNVKFHSRSTLTTEDVVYSVQRVLAIHDPDGPSWILEQVLTNHVASYVDSCGPALTQACSIADYADGAFRSRQEIPVNIRTTLNATVPEVDWSVTNLTWRLAWSVSNSTVEKIGTNQVVIHLTRPYPALLQALASTVGSIVERACVETHGGVQWGVRNAVLARQMDCGTGPFELRSWVPNQGIILDRFDAYSGTAPAINEIHITKATDATTREFMLWSGDADVATITRDHQSDVMNPDGTPRSTTLRIIKDRPSFDILFLGYNQAINRSASPDPLTIPTLFFADVHVRRAFSYAFDYQGFLQNVTHNTGIPLRGPIAQGIPGYNMSIPLFAYNLSKAATELRQTPYWSSGFNLTLYYNAGNTERAQACRILAQGLEALPSREGSGPIIVTVRGLDWPAYIGAIRTNSLPILFLGWRPDYADPDDYVIPLLRSGATFPSRIGYTNTTIDALIEAAASELNQTLQIKLYQDLSARAVQDDVPYLWVYQARSFHVERTWLRGFYFNPMLAGLDYHTLWKAST